MTLGTRLGPYEVLSLLGAGGMGEVYRAKDSTLKREVALKVLPVDVARDRERLARFQREAEVLASLNHPHIAQIYGLEHAGDTFALVMELVEGEDLAQRVARGPIPLDEALPIARQIAEALEAAHAHGIIHRDLKPANIKLRSDGTVKVLDFGLAKATDPSAGSSATAMNSPTLSIHATQAGIILGTAAYMSPEQAAGKAVDKRSDLWAFGAVLMEMLTGRQVFKGETVSHLIAAVLKDEPDWTALPANTPQPIRKLLRRCLEKDRKRRLADAADARLEIDDALSPALHDGVTDGLPRATPRRLWSRLLPWGVATAALLAAAMLAWRASDDRNGGPTMYASLEAPPDYVLGEDDALASLPTRTPMVFTPDGKSLIIQAARAGKPQLFIRSLDRPDTRPIAGTDDGRAPFVSPDGQWIGFWAAGELRKVPIDGGSAATIYPLPQNVPLGAAWGPADVIVFADAASRRIMRISANGGTPVAVTEPPSAPDRRQHVAPHFLPDGKRILFSDVSNEDATDVRLMVQALTGGPARLVLAGATDGRVLPSGQLAFMQLGTLMTVAFNATSAEVRGEPASALGEVMQSGLRGLSNAQNTGAGMFAVSALGTLAAIRGSVTGPDATSMAWVTRDGQLSSVEPASGAPGGGRLHFRNAPDGLRAAVAVSLPLRRELWFADARRGLWTLCATCKATRGLGIWSPGGDQILVGRNGTLVTHALDESTPEQLLVKELDRYLIPTAWLRDGRVVYLSSPDQTRYEIKVLEKGGSAGQVVVTLGDVSDGEVSPDGRWLAYRSTENGQPKVIVQAFPGPGSRTQVSADAASNPVWSADGRTLYYLSMGRLDTSVFFAVDLVPGATFRPGTPRELFRSPQRQDCGPMRCYEVSADGQRFLLRQRRATAPRESVSRMDLVLNWTNTLPKDY